MFVQRPGTAPKRHYRYYTCARRVESRSCDQPYIPAARLEGTVIGKIQELSTRPDLLRPFLAREIKRRKAANRERERRARGLERRIADLEDRQGRLVDWLAETLPGKAAARKLNEKIERLEEEKKRLTKERAGIEVRADQNLEGVTAEAVAHHLAEFGYYLDQFNPGQRKELLEAVVQAVTVEGPARARLRLDLPIRPLGKLDRQGSKRCPVWRPQRDSNLCVAKTALWPLPDQTPPAIPSYPRTPTASPSAPRRSGGAP